jgi:hypothetical protein
MGNLLPVKREAESGPNLELLRRDGWSINSCHGPYVVAWRGSSEQIVVRWRNGAWERLDGRGGPVA